MNKQELIDYCNDLKESKSRFINCIDVDRIIETIKQLDEPEKVQVPQFVTNWYEENKDDFETSLFQCVYEIFKKRNDNELNEFEKWLIDENTKPFQTLVNMHQFGYDVEEEKRYLVKVVGMDSVNGYLSYNKDLDRWFFGIASKSKPYRSHHTRKELEDAGFGWVFDCPGIKIKEVE